MPKKLLISVTTITFTLFIILSLLFYPLFNLKSSVKDTQSNTDYVVNWYNPLKPKLTAITKLSGSDGYILVVSDYNRTGLFGYEYAGEVNGNKKPQDFAQVNAQITNKSLDEVKQIAKTQDLSTKPYTPEKSNFEKQYEEEQKKPVECQRVIRDDKKYDATFITRINKNMLLLDFLKTKSVTGEMLLSNKGIYFLSINSSTNSEIKYNIYSENQDYDTNPSVKITKVTKVFADCHEEEIPLN